MRLNLTYILILLTALLYAQGGFKREYKLPNALNNTSKAVFETTLGNYIMGGFISEAENGININRLNLFGINSQGQRTWTKKYGNSKFEYLDNSLIIKWFYKQDNYLYHAGCVRDSNNKRLGVLIKFDFNGDTMWQKKFYDPNCDVIPQMVTGSVDGGFLITGFFEDASSQPLLIIKTDANGNELWRKKINKAVPNVHDGKTIIQDSASKKIVIAGYQYQGNQNAWANKDNILILDSLGTKISQLSYTGGNGGLFFDMIQTKDKGIVAVGNVIYPQTIGGTNLNRSFMIKFDLNSPSVPIWKIDGFDMLTIGNSFLNVKELKNRDLLVGGGIDTMRINNLPTQALNRITRIDKNGNILWNRNYDYSVSKNFDNIQSIMSLEIASNGDWLTAVQVQNISPNPFMFVRYDSTGCDSTINYCLTVGVDEKNKDENSLGIYPNPVKSMLNINFSKLNYFGEKVSFKITDVIGKIVKEDGVKQLCEKQFIIDFTEMDKGIYFLHLYNNNGFIASKKIMKE